MTLDVSPLEKSRYALTKDHSRKAYYDPRIEGFWYAPREHPCPGRRRSALLSGVHNLQDSLFGRRKKYVQIEMVSAELLPVLCLVLTFHFADETTLQHYCCPGGGRTGGSRRIR